MPMKQDAKPLFSEPLHVGRPNVGNLERFRELVEGMFERRWFTNSGPLVQEFERRIAAEVGVRHCVTMCNATVALEIAARALGLSGEVIVPAYTFVATAHALQWQGITPVFADMDPRTHNVDPAHVERLVNARTTGIVGVHVWGRGCDTEALEAIGRRRGLVVMYDAAHAFGCSHRGRRIGGNGACEVFSFHATKFLNSFEGGAVVTQDDALAEKMRLMRNFGFKGFDTVVHPGVNGKMTEVCAAMGLVSLEAMEDLMALNRRNHGHYAEGLRGIPGVRLMDYPSAERMNHQYVVVEVDLAEAGVDRDAVVAALHAENVLARKYFWPGCHRMEPYRTLRPEGYLELPETERVSARVVVLPTGQAVGAEIIRAVCGIIRGVVARGGGKCVANGTGVGGGE